MSGFSGHNYVVEVGDDRLVTARIRRCSDLDTSAGADEVERMASELRGAANGSADALLLDLTEAPPVIGPRTQSTLESLLRDWVTHGRRAAIVLGASAVQRMQVDRLVASVGSPALMVPSSIETAMAWLRDRP